MFNGLRSVIYPSADLAADKKFWQEATGVKPYFDQPYYVGFDIAGCELGLDPNSAKEGVDYPVTYWLVKNIEAATKKVLASGATTQSEPKDVGEGILMARFQDPTGNIFGLVQNPHTK
jgi:predicted enzyme related to lactoylglutathione lyase